MSEEEQTPEEIKNPSDELYLMFPEDDGTWYIYLSDEFISDTHRYAGLLNRLHCDIKEENKVRLYLASDGGCVSSALRLCYAIKRCKAHVTIVVDAPCYSAGSMLALSGDALELATGAFLMFHPCIMSNMSGRLNEIRRDAKAEQRHSGVYHKDMCYPFLSNKELSDIEDNDKTLYIYGDDKDINKRIKRHFKGRRYK